MLQVHLLNDESRGATMEAVVSRMKTIQRAMGRETTAAGGATSKHGIRFIAVSATVPNAQDVGQILSVFINWRFLNSAHEQYMSKKSLLLFLF